MRLPSLQPRARACKSSDRDAERLHRAVRGLAEWRPDLSATEPLWPRQACAFALFAITIGSLVACFGSHVAAPLAWLIAAPFLVSACVRLGALRLMSGYPGAASPRPAPFHGPVDLLPSYTLLVPLYREEGVAPQIVEALHALD